MDAPQLAAQFAAFTWFTECYAGPKNTQQASRFARDNWQAFAGTVPEGLGRLLTRIGRLDRPRRRKKAPLQMGRAG